ncbi:MAG TPA: TadE/TadG family type IV pilus assembly protein [Candidatus Limnocylindrales bacterium]|nr:TadE/TadG family type IV pilus assembly protein [Candidatus Limnocylindrales bacterium]
MNRRSGREGGRGQSLVEFALVLPIFMLMIFGIIDGGRMVFANNDMAQSTRNVARVASTTCFDTTPACDKSAGPIATAIAAQRNGMLVNPTWTIQCVDHVTGAIRLNNGTSDPCRVGDLVRVSVASPMVFVTPVASSFGPVNLGSKSEQEILQ